ncbi:MAG: ATP-binding protein, partial [Candidatus Thiodiazotropha sp.]
MPLALYGKKATQGCPCGHLGDGSNRCHCTLDRITRYRNRISGP